MLSAEHMLLVCSSMWLFSCPHPAFSVNPLHVMQQPPEFRIIKCIISLESFVQWNLFVIPTMISIFWVTSERWLLYYKPLCTTLGHLSHKYTVFITKRWLPLQRQICKAQAHEMWERQWSANNEQKVSFTTIFSVFLKVATSQVFIILQVLFTRSELLLLQQSHITVHIMTWWSLSVMESYVIQVIIANSE